LSLSGLERFNQQEKNHLAPNGTIRRFAAGRMPPKLRVLKFSFTLKNLHVFWFEVTFVFVRSIRYMGLRRRHFQSNFSGTANVRLHCGSNLYARKQALSIFGKVNDNVGSSENPFSVAME
jgi:hypothetical protein